MFRQKGEQTKRQEEEQPAAEAEAGNYDADCWLWWPEKLLTKKHGGHTLHKPRGVPWCGYHKCMRTIMSPRPDVISMSLMRVLW